MTANLRRLGLAFTVAFAATALALGYWGVIRSDALLAREDNPRRVEAEMAIQRGQILDRHGTTLAFSEQTNGILRRIYPYPKATPVVGYYSLRYGAGGVEAAYDDVLRGDAFLTPDQVFANELHHHARVGGDVRLTLDLALQQAAEAALGEVHGGLVLVAVPSGDILALASSPTYDANQLEESWDTLSEDPAAPLVNRVTQGLYPPGAAFQSVLLGAGLNTDAVSLEQSIERDRLEIEIEEGSLRCGLPPDRPVETLLDAYVWACPAPFPAVGEALGREQIESTLTDFGLGLAPPLGLPPERVAASEPTTEIDLSALSLGQGGLTMTPLQMVLVAAAIPNHGEAPALRLADAVRAPGGDWESLPSEGHPHAAISRDSADALAGAMRQAVRYGAASAANLSDVRVSGHAGLAAASGEGTTNAWFIGFAPWDQGGWLAIAVLVEDAQDASDAARIAGKAMGAALNAEP